MTTLDPMSTKSTKKESNPAKEITKFASEHIFPNSKSLRFSSYGTILEFYQSGIKSALASSRTPEKERKFILGIRELGGYGGYSPQITLKYIAGTCGEFGIEPDEISEFVPEYEIVKALVKKEEDLKQKINDFQLTYLAPFRSELKESILFCLLKNLGSSSPAPKKTDIASGVFDYVSRVKSSKAKTIEKYSSFGV